MLPQVPPSKKRRRTIIDAFQLINLRTEHQRRGVEVSPGSNEAIGNGDDEADSSKAVAEFAEALSTTSTIEDYDDDADSADYELGKLLSDREESERKVMFSLVFGPPSPSDPVESKIQKWIRSQQNVPRELQEAQDDMHVDASYSLPSSRAFRPTRSNSLPNIFSDEDEMSIDM